jgi:hypothetical protein
MAAMRRSTPTATTPRGRVLATLATLATLAVAFAAAFAAPTALADGGAKTRIEITRLTATMIKGTIKSEREACEKRRHVQIFRYDGFLSVKIARFDAQRDGDWKTTRDLQPGRYFAKVDSTKGCRYDVSPEKRLR